MEKTKKDGHQALLNEGEENELVSVFMLSSRGQGLFAGTVEAVVQVLGPRTVWVWPHCVRPRAQGGVEGGVLLQGL